MDRRADLHNGKLRIAKGAGIEPFKRLKIVRSELCLEFKIFTESAIEKQFFDCV